MNYEITFSIPYDAPRPDSEDAPQPSYSEISGLASFLALAIMLQVPILTQYIGSERWGCSTLGAGTSFHVTRSYSSHRTKYLEPNATIQGSIDGIGERFKSCSGLVSKRLCRRPQHDDDDGRCLAPLVQEMRILSHETLRDAPNLVRMICLDWSEDSADGRCWPTMLLECATHGTLGQYLLRTPRLSWNLILMLCLNVAGGLQTLHEHDVVHCDLKPDNILVVKDPNSKVPGGGVVAKISDFGYSVITSDYDGGAVFRGRAGTPPWNAPEIAFGRNPLVDSLPKADIYSMGLILCTIVLRGHPPWESISAVAFQNLKESNDDRAVSRVLGDALSERNIKQEGWIEEILATVKSDPRDRCSATGLIFIIMRGLIADIFDAEDTNPDEIEETSVAEDETSDAEDINPDEINETSDAEAIDHDKIGIKFRRAHLDAKPLPNIFSAEFKDANMQSFTGVPDFTDIGSFKPCLLHKNALLEVTTDLLRRSESCRQDTASAVAEAEYQLCICYFEGYGVEQNVPLGLTYLARAFDHGCPEARYNARNFYEAFDRDFPAAMALTEEMYLFVMTMDKAVFGRRFDAVEALCHRYPRGYEMWVCSAADRNLRWRELMYCLAHLTVDLSQTDWPNPNRLSRVLAALDDLYKVTPGIEMLSELHCAAAVGDLESVNRLAAQGDVNTAAPHVGWTPLWLACSGGCYEAAVALLERGAAICCRETNSGRGILHLLQAFRSRSEIKFIVERAREGGLDIDDPDSNGATPLLATFDGWDISRGAAASVLLVEGANPCAKDHDGICPFVVCVAKLDLTLLQEMLASPAMDRLSEDVVCEAQTTGLGALILPSPAVQIASLGKRRESVIKGLLQQLLSDSSTQRFLHQPHGGGRSPLVAAVWLDHHTLASWLLELRPQDIDLRNGTGRTALQWAIIRKRGRLVQQLLDHGADPLITDDIGCNALHVAAVSMPAVMPILAEVIVSTHCGVNVDRARLWLDQTDLAGCTPFQRAVIVGGEEHLKYAEILRSKYQLEHDSPIGEQGPTLLGAIVQTGSVTDQVNREQVEYLLRLSPKPRFVIHADGSTLLHTAVMGWKNADDYSDGAVGYDILGLLLEAFPSQEHIEALDDCNASALIRAALYANNNAIAMLRDHAAAHSLSLDVNRTDVNRLTALDMVGSLAVGLALDEETGSVQSSAEAAQSPLSTRTGELDPGTEELIKEKIRRTKQILVPMGAVGSDLLNGIVVWTAIMSPISVPHDRQIQFLVAMQQENAGLVVDAQPTPPPEGSYINIECSWRQSTFFISLTGFPSMTEAKAHSIKRWEQGTIQLQSWRIDHGARPWEETKYENKELAISWERPGRVWDSREVWQLYNRITKAWVAVTGCEIDIVVVSFGW